MGSDENRYQSGNVIIRVEAGKLVLPVDVGARVTNFVSTAEGTLSAVSGPLPYLPTYGDGYFNYGTPHGIFHAILENSPYIRDVLIVHSGDCIRVFEGWNRSWRTLIGPDGSGAQIVTDLPNDSGPRYPTQFEATPTGIVIVPQGHNRAYFYDGDTVLSLGYTVCPTAPNGVGPESETDITTGVTVPNGVGYNGGEIVIGGRADFGYGRLGTVQSDVTGVQSGTVLSGAYQAAYQWIDQFGNLSPVSPRSNAVTIDREIVSSSGHLDWHLKMALWTSIQAGPDGTIGRIFCRTKDIRNAGTTWLFEVPGNVIYGTSGSYATIPDNITEKWPDNVPDSWLFTRPTEVMPVPQFKLCRMAFGRLWIGGIRGNESAIIPSLPGRWGTFGAGTEVYPDPSGGEPTAMWTVVGGLLVTTLTSTFMVVPTDDGLTWKPIPIHPTIGCVAPDSMRNLPDGSTIWLSREGYVRFSESGGIEIISDDNQETVERINPGRAMQACAAVDPKSREYRCWVPLDAAIENTTCIVYDYSSPGWRRRNGESARGVCVTRDHRAYMLIAGYVDRESGGFVIYDPDAGILDLLDADGDPIDYSRGVWLLDHEVPSFVPKARTYTIETSWIDGARSKDAKSAKMVYLWLRESDKRTLTVKVHRDWRKRSTAVYQDTALMYSEDDPPPFWGTTKYGETDAEWVRRRPFWQKVSIYVPSCEVYKIVIESTTKIEFIGMSFDDLPHPGSARVEGE